MRIWLLPHHGDAFDSLGLAGNPDTFAELKIRAIEKGYSTMLSMFGYYVQAIVTGEEPIENWASHATDPFAVKSLTPAYFAQLAPSPVAMFAASTCKATELSTWYGPDRNERLGPFSECCTPVYLTGTHPSDCDWDTDGLGAVQTTLGWHREAELIHTR